MTETLDHIVQADQEFFLWLNGMHSYFWDEVMRTITNKFTWIPMYLLLFYGIISEFKIKAIGYIACILAAVILSDQIASSLFKPYFMRPRPCHDPVIGHLVNVVSGCGGQYGFVSSHAATGFAIAMIVNLLPAKNVNAVKWLFLWASIYSYSRIYVGVHYPLDIFFGGLVGVISAILVFLVFRSLDKRGVLRPK